MIQEKISWFEKIELLTVSNEDKSEIAKSIVTEDGKGDKLYWMEIVLSSAIATFGLLQVSVAIIIGAMLIAPLLQPMKAMAFAIATGRSRFFWKAFFFLFKSVLLSIIVASFLLYLSPIQIENKEILARTTPNILDLFVAILSAMVAFLSLAYKKLSASVAGVAMAASLMPPLAVCGIELTLKHYSLAWGGFFLFFVNFLAILIVGVIIFMMYGFTPHEELKKKITSRKIFTLITLILLTTYPLYSSISYISEKIKVHEQAENFLEQQLDQYIKDGELTGLEVLSISKKEIKFFGSVRIPENVKVYQESYTSLVEGLKELFKKDIDLQLEMVRTASFATKNIATDPQNILHTLLRKNFQEIFPHLSLIQLESQKINEDDSWISRLTVSIPSGEYLEENSKKMFEKKISKTFLNGTEKIKFVWVPIAEAPEKKEIKQSSPEEKFREKLLLEWEHFFANKFFQNIEVQNLKISWTQQNNTKNFTPEKIQTITISATIYHPSSQREQAIINYIKKFRPKHSYKKVSLIFKFSEYHEKRIEIENQ